jgi:hypothetical protein
MIKKKQMRTDQYIYKKNKNKTKTKTKNTDVWVSVRPCLCSSAQIGSSRRYRGELFTLAKKFLKLKTNKVGDHEFRIAMLKIIIVELGRN